MKSCTITFICLLGLTLNPAKSFAQAPDSNSTIIEWLDYIYEPIDTCDNINTGLLLDKGMMDSFFFNYRGMLSDSFGHKDIWYEMYNTVRTAGLDSLPPLDSVYRWAGEYIDQGFIPIIGMNFIYNFLNPVALDSGWVDTLGGQYIPVPGENPFLERELVSFASTLNMQYGDTFQFLFPSELYFSNETEELQGMEIKIWDGEWQELAFDSPLLLTIHDLDGPSQEIEFDVKLIYNGFIRVSTYIFRIAFVDYFGDSIIYEDERPYLYDAEIGTNILTADNAIVGSNPAKGYAAITFGKDGNGNKHTCFTKPLIIVEGIDFGTRELPVGCRYGKCGFLGWQDIVTGANPELPELANGPKFVKDLTDKGYDLIYLDFYDGATYMEDNAMVVVKLIQHINQYKCGNEEIVICGVSMGGPLTKYALSYMETNNLEHCVRTYVSFDGPHQGANIVLGLQQFIQYASEKTGNADAKFTYVRKLLRPATKQLLKHHIGGTNFEPHYERAFFLQNQTLVGNYPRQTRNVAIINGSATMQNMGFDGGDRLLEWKYKRGINVDVEIFSLCGDGSDRTCLVKLPFDKKRTYQAPSICTALDHVPGSIRRDIKNELNGRQWAGPIFLGVANCFFDDQCFTPSISTLDVNTGNYFFDIKNGIDPPNKPNPGLYPFEAYYAPTNNEQHVYLSYDLADPTDPLKSNIAWLVNEVESSRVGLTQSTFSSTYNFGEGNKNRFPGLTIANGGVIHINGAYATGIGTGPTPIGGSTFSVTQRGCDKLVKVQSGGLLQVGDDNTPTNNMGSLIFPKGSTLELEASSTLRIHNNSSLIIEAGATLIVHSGAQILLDGPEAVLEIRGTLKIMSGTFSFSKTSGFTGGYVRFDLSDPGAGIISMGTTGKIALTGSSSPTTMDKVLEIVGGTLSTPNQDQSLINYLSEFNVTNGMVAIGSGSEFELSVTGAFSNSYFIGLSAVNSTGMRVLDADLLTISNCSFRDLGLGLFINLNSTSSNPSYSFLSFHDNGVGLETENGALDIHNYVFANNGTAWWANTMSRNAHVYQSTFISNDYGILFGNTTAKLLYLEEIDFSQNGIGVFAEDEMEIVAQCCLFQLHTGKGILADGVLNLSTSHTTSGKTGGNCAFYNNELAAEIYGELYLDEGGNVFINNGTYSSETFFTGTLPACNPCAFMNSSWQIYSADNYWDPGYQSSLQVSTTPNPSSAGFTGTTHSTFTSSCFNEGGSGNPVFAQGWSAPQYKKEQDSIMQDFAEERGSSIVLSPNPADNTLRLSGFSEDERVLVTLYDLKGALVKRMELNEGTGYQLSTEYLTDGLYMLHVRRPGGVETFKIMIYHR
ncbi:MAG: T9SS type A sorting domain-containing protein [Bacteroidia bacterium]